METTVSEVADGIYQLYTYVPEANFSFNQYLVSGEEPLLFHTGLRAMFPLVRDAVAQVLPPESLRWITFGHVEGDECGSMNLWLQAAPRAEVAHGAMGCLVQINDLADRPPRPLTAGEVIDTGAHRLRYLATPHVPHGWDAGLYYDEVTGTLLCGDLFTAAGKHAACTDADIIGPAIAAEDFFGATCLTPATGPTIRTLAALQPARLALMHGPVFTGDGGAALVTLADEYDHRLAEQGQVMHLPRVPGA
ncbi:MAG TPA: MBL fold metallo-hydrolase [Mycobacteriales bacterium]|nr:MBL fold metallo-hydrolase [Mycobacteriales bacterium]